jgi:hypothetical protein
MLRYCLREREREREREEERNYVAERENCRNIDCGGALLAHTAHNLPEIERARAPNSLDARLNSANRSHPQHTNFVAFTRNSEINRLGIPERVNVVGCVLEKQIY